MSRGDWIMVLIFTVPATLITISLIAWAISGAISEAQEGKRRLEHEAERRTDVEREAKKIRNEVIVPFCYCGQRMYQSRPGHWFCGECGQEDITMARWRSTPLHPHLYSARCQFCGHDRVTAFCAACGKRQARTLTASDLNRINRHLESLTKG